MLDLRQVYHDPVHSQTPQDSALTGLGSTIHFAPRLSLDILGPLGGTLGSPDIDDLAVSNPLEHGNLEVDLPHGIKESHKENPQQLEDPLQSIDDDYSIRR